MVFPVAAPLVSLCSYFEKRNATRCAEIRSKRNRRSVHDHAIRMSAEKANFSALKITTAILAVIIYLSEERSESVDTMYLLLARSLK